MLLVHYYSIHSFMWRHKHNKLSVRYLNVDNVSMEVCNVLIFAHPLANVSSS